MKAPEQFLGAVQPTPGVDIGAARRQATRVERVAQDMTQAELASEAGV